MASKRSGRTYQDEGSHAHVQDRRQSRSLKHDDVPRDERVDSKSSSSNGSRDSSRSPDIVIDMALGEKTVVSVELKTSISTPAGGRIPPLIDTEIESNVASIPMPLSPTTKYHVPAQGQPFNFGEVVPGVYRSSYPTPQDFSYMKELGLKTVV